MAAVALLCAFANLSAAGGKGNESMKAPVELDGPVVEALMIATRDFKKSHGSFKCFIVEVSEEDAVIHVAFIPKQSAGGEITLGGRTQCGAGVSYNVESGKIVKKWFAR